MERTLDPRNPTISPGNASPLESRISQDSPTEQNGPADSTRLPTTWVTRPLQRIEDPLASQMRHESRCPGVIWLRACAQDFVRASRRSLSRFPSVAHRTQRRPYPDRSRAGSRLLPMKNLRRLAWWNCRGNNDASSQLLPG